MAGGVRRRPPQFLPGIPADYAARRLRAAAARCDDHAVTGTAGRGRGRAVVAGLGVVLAAAAGCSGGGQKAAPAPTGGLPSFAATDTPSPGASTPGDGTSASPTATATASASASATGTGTPSATGPSSSASPSPGVSGRCHTSELAASAGQTNGAAGTTYGTIVLRNTSSTACTLTGFPGLLRLDASGRPLPTTVVRSQDTPTRVPLAPGAVASFGYSYSNVPSGNATACAPPATLTQVTPPDERDRLSVRVALSPCEGGRVLVGPVRAGANATVGQPG